MRSGAHFSRAASVSFLVAAITVALGLASFPMPVLTWPVLAVGLLILLNYFKLGQNFVLSWRWAFLIAVSLATIAYVQKYAEIKNVVRGWWLGYRDHRQIEAKLPIFPQRLSGERPQRFLIYAPHSQNLTLSWSDRASQTFTTIYLGSGLFRWDYNPRRQGPPPIREHCGHLTLSSDGDGTTRVEMPYVEPLARPALLCSDPGTGQAATVSELTDEVIVADREGGVQRFPVEDGPTACALLERGKTLVVGHRYDRSVWLMDALSGQPKARRHLDGGVENLAVSPDEKTLALLYEGLSPALAILRLPDLEVLATVPLPYAGEFLCFGRDSGEVVIASRRGRHMMRCLGCPDGRWNVAQPSLPLTRPATALCRGPQGRRVFITATSGKVDGTEQKGNHYVKDTILGLDLESWSWVSRKATEDRREIQKEAGCIDSGCGPTDLKFDGRDLLVAFSGTHEVARFPLHDGLDRRIDLSPQGLLCPYSLADLGQGLQLVSFPAQGMLVWINQHGDICHRRRLTPGDDRLEASDYGAWQRRQGEICFTEATNAGISCQSCHPRGDSDYARHDLGDVRQWGTLSLEGVADTAPYLRAAPYPSLPDLHAVADTEFRGFRRETDLDRAAVTAAYMEGLPLPTNPRQLMEETPQQLDTQRRGLQAFIKANCTDCHSFPATTNLAVVPNQVLFPGPQGPYYYEPVDVPSLRALWRSAPYLHDGRAQTLDDILVKENPHDQHGRTSQLSDAERSDLIEFLLSL